MVLTPRSVPMRHFNAAQPSFSRQPIGAALPATAEAADKGRMCLPLSPLRAVCAIAAPTSWQHYL